MLRFSISFLAAMIYAPMVLSGQGFTIQLSGGTDGSSFSFGGPDGAPLVLAPVPGYMPTQPDRLLNMPRVATDLQLLPEQKEELQAKFQELRDEHTRRSDRIANSLNGEIPEQERERLNQRLAELQGRLREEIKTAIDEVLLPFQKKRLDQIVAQSRLNNEGSSALENEEFARLLKLTEEQKREILKQQEEMQKQLQEEIVALRRKRQRELLESVLTKDQMERLKDLVGDDLGPAEKTDRPRVESRDQQVR